ncbi:hypothetical protein AMECASPLE_038303 [Ameca splendens]|uniref:SWIM-type domain-containing protein n=1 Tax=Ameca splendens TaxID=208324 RepID=A0ABV1A3J7_9TELE
MFRTSRFFNSDMLGGTAVKYQQMEENSYGPQSESELTLLASFVCRNKESDFSCHCSHRMSTSIQTTTTMCKHLNKDKEQYVQNYWPWDQEKLEGFQRGIAGKS